MIQATHDFIYIFCFFTIGYRVFFKTIVVVNGLLRDELCQ